MAILKLLVGEILPLLLYIILTEDCLQYLVTTASVLASAADLLGRGRHQPFAGQIGLPVPPLQLRGLGKNHPT